MQTQRKGIYAKVKTVDKKQRGFGKSPFQTHSTLIVMAGINTQCYLFLTFNFLSTNKKHNKGKFSTCRKLIYNLHALTSF